MSVRSGEELYSDFAAGDSGAFDALVEMYSEELLYFLYGIVRDHHEARHLVIDTFAQLAISRAKYAGKSSLKTYLFGIGKNLAAQYIKKRGREQHLSFEEVAHTLVDKGESPEDFLERKEDSLLLYEAMRTLKEEHRMVLMLLYFQNMSYAQAARAMKKTEHQIRGLAFRAKRALKERL